MTNPELLQELRSQLETELEEDKAQGWLLSVDEHSLRTNDLAICKNLGDFATYCRDQSHDVWAFCFRLASILDSEELHQIAEAGQHQTTTQQNMIDHLASAGFDCANFPEAGSWDT